MAEVCGSSPKKILILKAVKKTQFYKDVAKQVRANASYCSNALNEMAIHGLVEQEGSRGFYRQTPAIRKIDIDAQLRKAGRKPPTVSGNKPSLRIVKVVDIEGSLNELDVDAELIRDCFPLRKPFRTHAGEAFLTLENMIKKELSLPDTVYGVEVVAAAKSRGVFTRPVRSETDGLVQLYNSAFLWYRNIFHHKKDEVSRQEALKIIFHADYLIKLFRKQKRLNGIS